MKTELAKLMANYELLTKLSEEALELIRLRKQAERNLGTWDTHEENLTVFQAVEAELKLLQNSDAAPQ